MRLTFRCVFQMVCCIVRGVFSMGLAYLWCWFLCAVTWSFFRWEYVLVRSRFRWNMIRNSPLWGCVFYGFRDLNYVSWFFSLTFGWLPTRYCALLALLHLFMAISSCALDWFHTFVNPAGTSQGVMYLLNTDVYSGFCCAAFSDIIYRILSQIGILQKLYIIFSLYGQFLLYLLIMTHYFVRFTFIHIFVAWHFQFY